MTELASVERLLAARERSLHQKVGQAKALAARSKELKAEVAALALTVEACDEAIGVLNSFADERAEEAQRKIEALVTHGLQTIFSPDMSFHVRNEVKAKRNETRFVVSSTYAGQRMETEILEARGGGVAAVAGFLLRLIVAMLRTDVRRTLFLDESFAQVSAEYMPKVVDFVRELVSKTDVQIVLVTHSGTDDWVEAADKAYQTSLVDGKTQIKALT